jgi:hypothetical protein
MIFIKYSIKPLFLHTLFINRFHMKNTLLTWILFLAGSLTVFGQKDISESTTIAKPVYFDVSPPLRDLVAKAEKNPSTAWKDGIIMNHFNVRHKNPQDILPESFTDPVLQGPMGMVPTDTTIQNFAGTGMPNGNGWPPDTDGDVSPDYYFQVVNCQYAVYSKTGTLLLGPTPSSTIWNGLPNNSNDGDAIVLWDEQAGRWLFSQFSLPSYPSGPFYQMIAVSQTSDPTGSWYRWEYSFSDMPDYPKFGVWPDGYYMSANRFASGSGNYVGTLAVAYDRTSMLTGATSPASVQKTLSSSNEAWSMLPSDCDGTFPASGTPNYFTYMYDANPYHLGILEFHVDWVTPGNSTLGNLLTLSVSSFNSTLSNISQQGTSNKLDPISDRLMARLQFRQFTGYTSMVVNHTVNVGSNRAGIRWYELRNSGSGWTVYQQSTYAPTGDTKSRWMGSIAQAANGDIALGFSISSSSSYPSIRYTGRLSTDPLNQMTYAEHGIANGTGSQTTYNRWGDYSAMACDPSSTGVFWYTQEYYLSTGTQWKTRIASFSFGVPFTVDATATPSTIDVGQSSQLNAVASGGSGVYTYSWTSNPPGFTSTQQNPVVSPVNTTMYIVTCNDGSQNRIDSCQVMVNMFVTATADPYTIDPGQSTQLGSSVVGGKGNYTYSWTSVPAGFTSTLPNPSASPTVNTVYTCAVSDGQQNNSDTAKVNVNMTMVATANPYTIDPGQTSQLNAQVSGGSGTYSYTWTSNPPGFNSNTQSPIVSPAVNTIYNCVASDGTTALSDTAGVKVNLAATATATPSNICIGSSSQLNVIAQGGTGNYTYQWTSNPPGFNSTIPNPVVSPTVNTDYYIHVVDGTLNAYDTTTVYVTDTPTVYSGIDTTICDNVTQFRVSGTATNQASVSWSTSGDGSFSVPSSLSTLYYPGTGDVATGWVDLTLTAYPGYPCVNSVSDSRHITIDACTGIPGVGNSDFSFRLMPNPATGQVSITLEGLGNDPVRIMILDVQGRALLDEENQPDLGRIQKKMDISGFPRGIYFVRVVSSDINKIQKLIIQ